MKNLGSLIKTQRKKRNISLQKLGLLTNVSDTEIMKIENGSRKKVPWETLCKIGKALDIHPLEILKIAGYISESDIKANNFLTGISELTSDELETVQLFINFILSNKKNEVS